jgi:hypothetical protein
MATRERLQKKLEERHAPPEDKAKNAKATLKTLPKGNYLLLEYQKKLYVADIELDHENKKIKYTWISEVNQDIAEIAQQFAGNLVDGIMKKEKEFDNGNNDTLKVFVNRRQVYERFYENGIPNEVRDGLANLLQIIPPAPPT